MMKMLSNIEIILLYIVYEKPSYAYEINKVIEERNIRMWVRVGIASIYQVLKRLEDKDMLYSRPEREGQMPERKRYYITELGKKVLAEASKRLLSSIEWYYLDLNVGLESSDVLTPVEITKCLINRLAKVKSNIRRMKEIISSNSDMKFKQKALIKYLIYLRESEEAFLQEVLNNMAIGL